MCFSAGASFGASAVLLVVGVATVSKVRKRSQIPFASIPFVFSVQQFMEGVLWIALQDPAYSHWQQTFINIFVALGQLVWPVLVPLGILLLEKEADKKKILKGLLGVGVLMSTYLTYHLVSHEAHAEILTYHIHYEFDFPHAQFGINGIFYFLPTVISHFVSSLKKVQAQGILVFASFIITQIFYREFVFSVWCFFAALISVVIYSTIRDLQRAPSDTKAPAKNA